VSESPANEVPESVPPPSLGVLDAMRMGWRLMASDFGMLFVTGLVLALILLGLKFIPCLNYCEGIALVFLWGPFMAGWFFVIQQRADGGRTDLANLFRGFSERYWPSVVAALPVTLTGIVVGILAFAAQFGLQMGMPFLMEEMGMASRGGPPDEPLALFAAMVPFMLAVWGIHGLAALIVGIVNMFLMFAFLILWDPRHTGWEAAKASARLVRANLWKVLGFSVLFGLIWLVGWTVGLAVCCVGLLGTMPVFQIWHAGSILYLYRSWTGQPLVQPIAAPGPDAGAAEGEAPIPPADVLPPDA